MKLVRPAAARPERRSRDQRRHRRQPQGRPGFLFAALPGSKVDGREFAAKAEAQGAAAVLAGRDIDGLHIPLVTANDPRRAYALAAGAFYGAQPATCVAVTGTNGKTSVAGFCRQMFAHAGLKAASMGTLGLRISVPGQADEQLTPPGLTTPDAADVARLLAEAAQMGVHPPGAGSLVARHRPARLDAVKLTAAGFLNLTRITWTTTAPWAPTAPPRLRLFEGLLHRGGTAVLNGDSDSYPAFAAAAVCAGQSVMSVGEKSQGLRLVERTLLPEGQRLKVRFRGEVHDLRLPLAGAFPGLERAGRRGPSASPPASASSRRWRGLRSSKARRAACSGWARGRAAARPMSTTPTRRMG